MEIGRWARGPRASAQFLFKYITGKDSVQKNKNIHILAVKLLFYSLKFFLFFLFYKRQVRTADLLRLVVQAGGGEAGAGQRSEGLALPRLPGLP